MTQFSNQIWPDNRNFALCLTHDVDRVKKSYQYFTYFAKTLRPYHLLSMFLKEEPYWNFEKIMDLERKHDVKSTFFFLNEKKKTRMLSPKDFLLRYGRYDIHDPKIVEVICKLYSDDWEIGVHGSYDSFKNKDLLRQEKKELEEIVGDDIIGIRQHYLNLENKKTWKFQQEAGFRYDSSFGFRTKIGFRDNKYLPFHPFNNSAFLVIPLAIMDSALFDSSIDLNDAWKRCKRLIEQTEKQHSLLTVLWHQRVFNEKEFPGWSKIYEKIIIECKKRNAWVATTGEIAKWYGEK